MNRFERKRKARNDQKDDDENSDDVIDVPSGKREKHPILTQYPYQQPTHAGYLTSATLFPVNQQ